ncbi:hypothetical protein, partial [Xanthomonas fragariae]
AIAVEAAVRRTGQPQHGTGVIPAVHPSRPPAIGADERQLQQLWPEPGSDRALVLTLFPGQNKGCFRINHLAGTLFQRVPALFCRYFFYLSMD